MPELCAFIHDNDQWLIDFVASLDSQALQNTIRFQFTDGDQGRLSVQEILLHLLTHGSNYRGMASRTLAAAQLDRPKDTFTCYLHQLEPTRRG